MISPRERVARRIPVVAVEGARVPIQACLRQSALTALLAAGFAAGVAQVILMRELVVTAQGNELSMGVLLACWLLAGAVGSLMGRSAVAGADATRSGRLLLVLCALPVPLLIASLILVRAAPLTMARVADLCLHLPLAAKLLGWLALQPGEMLGLGQMALLGAAAALGPAALNGAQFAAGCALYAHGRTVGGAGPAYAADAVGHLVGGVLLASSVLLLLEPFTIALVVGAVNAGAALVLLRVVLRAKLRCLLALALGAGLILALASAGTPALHARSLRWRWHNHELLTSTESIYGNTAVMRQQPHGIYVYQNGLYSGASPPLAGTIDELVHFTLLQHPCPQRILMIGGGITGGLREALKYRPREVVYVELDAALFALADRWAAPEDAAALRDPRVRTVAADGRRYLAMLSGAQFDAAIMALPDPATAQLNRLYTREYYALLARALAPDAVAGWRVPGSEGYFSPSLLRLHRCLLHTAGTVFGRVAGMPGESSVVVASREGRLTEDWRVLAALLVERGVNAPYVEATLPDRLDPATLQAVAHALQAPYVAQTNTDLRPIGYFLDQTWWLTQFHPGSGRAFERLARLGLRDLLAPLAGVLTFFVGVSWLPPVRTGAIALGVAASGFASMSLEVALLFAFQAFYGYVYQMVGVIIGAFMVGVAAGSVWADRWVALRPPRAAGRALPVILALMAALSLATAAALPAIGATQGGRSLTWLFPLLTALIGLAVGAVFPLATDAWDSAHAARAAAGLYAADLAGAAVGAVLAGAFLAPVLGLVDTCGLMGALLAGAALLLAARLIWPP
ncbi:MAG: hypothetical protein AB7Y46_11345 [Armatimonadota bacterium]